MNTKKQIDKMLLSLGVYAASMMPSMAATLYVGAGQTYGTVNAALDAANDGDTIIIHKGTYRETCVVHDDNLTIKAADDEHVVITGLDSVSGWTQDAGEVYYADISLDAELDFPQVFVNNRRINPAAYPDCANDMTNFELWGQDLFIASSGAADFNTGKPNDHWAGGLLIHMTGSSYVMNYNTISNSTATTLTCDPTGTGQASNGDGKGMIIFHRNALDAANEFHYDQATGRVYLWQPGGGNPNSVQVRTRRWGLTLSDRSGVSVEGINFDAAAVDMTSSSYCTLRNCNVLYGSAFSKTPGNQQTYSVEAWEANDALISQCYIAHGWGGGIRIRSDYYNVQGMRNKVSDCVIEDVGWIGRSAGVFVYGKNKDMEVVNNTFRNLGGIGVQGFPRRSTISSNYFASCMNLSRDGGAIYVYGAGENASRSYNWIEQCWDYIHSSIGKVGNVRGIYTDGSADYHHVHHNVIWRCTDAVNSNNEQNDKILNGIRYNNNTFWDLEETMMSGWWAPNGYGEVEDMTTYNNLGNGVSAKHGGPEVPFLGTIDWTKTSVDPIEYYTNQIFNNYSTLEEGTTAADLFVDSTPDSFSDFQLKAGSVAIDYGVVTNGLPEAGTWNGAFPDAGAYEFGETWMAGASDFGLLAVDDFESGGQTGGTGWAGGWAFSGDATVGATPLHGEFGIRLRGSGGSDLAERQVNLRGTKTGTLSYWWRGYSFDNSNEFVRISIIDGNTEVELRIVADGEDAATDGQSWSEWRLDTLDISGYTFTANVQTVRFDASALSGTGDYFYFDDVRIDDYDVVPRPLPASVMVIDLNFDNGSNIAPRAADTVQDDPGDYLYDWSSSNVLFNGSAALGQKIYGGYRGWVRTGSDPLPTSLNIFEVRNGSEDRLRLALADDGPGSPSNNGGYERSNMLLLWDSADFIASGHVFDGTTNSSFSLNVTQNLEGKGYRFVIRDGDTYYVANKIFGDSSAAFSADIDGMTTDLQWGEFNPNDFNLGSLNLGAVGLGQGVNFSSMTFTNVTGVGLYVQLDRWQGSYMQVSDFQVKLAPLWVEPVGYTAWATANGVGSMDEDNDKDGLNNLGEYAYKGDPNDPADQGMVGVNSVGGLFQLAYAQLIDTNEVEYAVEQTDDLVDGIWTNIGISVSSGSLDETYNMVTNSVPLEGQGFIRYTVKEK